MSRSGSVASSSLSAISLNSSRVYLPDLIAIRSSLRSPSGRIAPPRSPNPESAKPLTRTSILYACMACLVSYPKRSTSPPVDSVPRFSPDIIPS